MNAGWQKTVRSQISKESRAKKEKVIPTIEAQSVSPLAKSQSSTPSVTGTPAADDAWRLHHLGDTAITEPCSRTTGTLIRDSFSFQGKGRPWIRASRMRLRRSWSR